MALTFLPNLRMSPTSEADALRTKNASRLRRYNAYLDFYNGKQWDRPRRGRSSLVLNYARAIVNKGVSYLLPHRLGFAVDPVDRSAEALLAAREAERVLYAVYDDNDLQAVHMQAATNAAVLGDAAFKVFWDPAEGRIRVTSVDPFGFFPRWAADDLATLRQVDIAYRIAPEEAAALYGPVSAGGRDVEVLERWTATGFSLSVDSRTVRQVPNPCGFIPFVHLPNLQPPNESWGISDLEDVMPLIRELNERMSDEADIIRYHADPPVIFTGVTDHGDLAVGPGTVWDLPEGADVKLLEWRGQPAAVRDHIDRVQRAIYEIAESPRTSFGDTGRTLAGVALEMELRPLVQKTLRKRAFWEVALKRCNAMVLRLAERFGVGGARPGRFAPYRTRILWPPMLPTDEAQAVRNNVALVAAGIRSATTAMNALGAEDTQEELRQVVADRAALS